MTAYGKYMSSAAMLLDDPASAADTYWGIVAGAVQEWYSTVTAVWDAYDAIEQPAYKQYTDAIAAAESTYSQAATDAAAAWGDTTTSAWTEYEAAAKQAADDAQAQDDSALAIYQACYAAAAATYEAVVAAAGAAYDAVAVVAAGQLTAEYASANAADQSAFDSATAAWADSEGNAWAACLSVLTAADTAWMAGEDYLGANGATADQRGTSATGENAAFVVAETAQNQPEGDNLDIGSRSEAMTLPNGPDGLGPEWKLDPTHKNPNGLRFRHPSGRYLDWHPGEDGKPGWKGRDHWHDTGGKDHLPPGTKIPDPGPVSAPQSHPQPTLSPKLQVIVVGVGTVGGGYMVYRVGRMLPSLLPPLWPTIPVNFAIP
jgi:hypothetical protein